MTAPRPEHPRPAPIPPGTESCGCCDGVHRNTPAQIFNRSGLSALAYRVGTYAHFRSSLQSGLSSGAYPALAALRTRDDDDFTVALLDVVACAADVLTFYQERIANESYLRTAVERVSLEEMGRLTGYRPRPGVAAETLLAFTLETPPQPPPGAKPEAGTFVTGVPKELEIPQGLAVRSIPGPGEKPQVFETVERVKARPEWNAMQPWLDETRRPQNGDTAAYLKGARGDLKAGDALLFLGTPYLTGENTGNWEFRMLAGVEPDAEHGRTRVSWRQPLAWVGADGAPEVFLLRKRAAAYGHNAPSWSSMSTEFKTSYEGKADLGKEWPGFTLSPLGAIGTMGGWLDLDAAYPELQPGGYVVLSRAGNGGLQTIETLNVQVVAELGLTTQAQTQALFTINSAAEVSREEFALSGKVTRLSLSGSYYDNFENSVRGTSVFVRSERLELAPYPTDAPISGAAIAVAADVAQAEAGRQMLVRGVRTNDGAEVTYAVALVQAAAAGPARTLLTVKPPLPDALKRASVVVYGNVALASHGETVAQVLGSGDASRAHQQFELKQLPLTWRSADNELGAAMELTVRVNDVAWHARNTLFGTAPDDRAYTVESDEEGRQHVRFGDGRHGARVPSGNTNVRARYRKGIGAAGNVAADSLTQPSMPLLGLKGVSNPLPAEGGTDPESREEARATLPLTTRTLGRTVSLLDYEDFARGFSGIAKAQARALVLPTGPGIVITVAGPKNTVISANSRVWQQLQQALASSGDPHVVVRLLPHRQSTFRLGLKVKRHPDHDRDLVLANVEAALRRAFAFDARELAQPVQESEVVAIVHSVPGVIAVDLDFFYGGTEPAAQAAPPRHTRLLASRMSVKDGAPLAAEILTLDPAPLDRLEEMQ